jgi:lipoprotein-releasing system permease protein
MFELFVARRYLTAKRKQAVISVISVISILGVSAGVMTLIIALAINNGFRGTLQRALLGATAHVNIVEKKVDTGIPDWRPLVQKLKSHPGVTAVSASLYGGAILVSPIQNAECYLKGLAPGDRAELQRTLRQGSVQNLAGDTPGVILGAKLAEAVGARVGQEIQLMSPQGQVTPLGARPLYLTFRVAGIFETQFYDLDKAFAYADLSAVQRFFNLDDVVNAVELKLADLDHAPEFAAALEKSLDPRLSAVPWTEQNRTFLSALKLERAASVLTISLIELVAALNILITLVMMVMEKNRDIAILLAMGARRHQIRKIFLWQGALIGISGTLLGLLLGYGIAFLGERNRWIALDEQLYAMSYLPFEPRLVDGLWVAALSIGVSLLATLYPSFAATKIAPAEALRYE